MERLDWEAQRVGKRAAAPRASAGPATSPAIVARRAHARNAATVVAASTRPARPQSTHVATRAVVHGSAQSCSALSQNPVKTQREKAISPLAITYRKSAL